MKVAVAGMGLMGGLHAGVVRTLPGATLVGLIEVDTTRHRQLQEEFGVPVYASLTELRAAQAVDAMCVCTPDHLHTAITREALTHGIACLVEKPITTVSAEGRELVDLSRRTGTLLTVGHILRFDPRLQQAREAVGSGAIGQPQYARIWRCNPRQAGKKIGARTSVLWFLGIHDADLLRWVLGDEVVRVHAMGRQGLVSAFHDVVTATLEFRGGTLAHMENHWVLPDSRASTLDAGLKIFGSEGAIELNLAHFDFQITTSERQKYLDTYHWPRVGGEISGDLRREIEWFLHAARTGGAPLVAPEDGLAAVHICAAVEKSMATGEWVSVAGG